jgi:hypothetical protein
VNRFVRGEDNDPTAALADRFDAMIHLDETRAISPLETWSQRPEEAPETYPTGM